MSTFRTFGTTFGGVQGRFFYGVNGFGGIGTTTANTRESREYLVQAIIQTGSGEKPDNPAAFDAREVVENLSAIVVRPEPKNGA